MADEPAAPGEPPAAAVPGAHGGAGAAGQGAALDAGLLGAAAPDSRRIFLGGLSWETDEGECARVRPWRQGSARSAAPRGAASATVEAAPGRATAERACPFAHTHAPPAQIAGLQTSWRRTLSSMAPCRRW